MQGDPLSAVRSLPSRILTIALVCASLYAALLGAGAFAQDDETTPAPAPTETAAPAQTEAPAAPPAAQTPEQSDPTPFPSPVETVVEATPQPTQTAEAPPKADPTAQPTADAPAQAPAQAQAPAAAQPQAPAAGTEDQKPAAKAPKLGVDRVKRARKNDKHPNRKQGSSPEVCPRDGKLVGTVGMASTSTRGCVGADGKRGGGHGDGGTTVPFGGADSPAPAYTPSGVPTTANPGYTLAPPGPAPIGVPNFFIEKFRIPPFLLPIYQAAGIQYGVRWEVLAAINEIETDYGRNLNVSSAGALGWMQFMPATWKTYGVDANRDGRKDPFNPVDAIFAAARYLEAAGADTDLRNARSSPTTTPTGTSSPCSCARALIGGLPTDLVGSLTGLTQGRFPVDAKSRYADDLAEQRAATRVKPGKNAAMPIESDGTRRGIHIFGRQGAPVIAVQRRADRRGSATTAASAASSSCGTSTATPTLTRTWRGRHALRGAEGATQSKASQRSPKELALAEGRPQADSAPPARRPPEHSKRPKLAATAPKRAAKRHSPPPARSRVPKERLFAHPARARRPLCTAARRQLLDLGPTLAPGEDPQVLLHARLRPQREDVVLKPLVPGRKVIAGTILGRIGTSRRPRSAAPALRDPPRRPRRPAHRPEADPRRLEAARGHRDLPRAKAATRSAAPTPKQPTIGQIMLMSKEALQRDVLSNPRIDDLLAAAAATSRPAPIDRRVLATLEFLAASGLKPTVSSLHCGHGYYTASRQRLRALHGQRGRHRRRSTGSRSLGHQGEGSITDITIHRLLTLQGTMKPHQIICLMTYAGTDNTFALADHYDHIHVGFRPRTARTRAPRDSVAAVLKPSQWIKLIDRLGKIDEPDRRDAAVAVGHRGPGHQRPLRESLVGLRFRLRRNRGAAWAQSAGTCWVMQWTPPPPRASVAPRTGTASRPGNSDATSASASSSVSAPMTGTISAPLQT